MSICNTFANAFSAFQHLKSAVFATPKKTKFFAFPHCAKRLIFSFEIPIIVICSKLGRRKVYEKSQTDKKRRDF